MSSTLMLPKTGRFLAPFEDRSEPVPPQDMPVFISKANRPIDRQTTPGRCGNLDYCSLGMRRGLVQVPVAQPFLCPECGGALRPPGPGSRRAALLLPMMRMGFLLGGVGAGLVMGYVVGRAQTPVVQAAVRVRQAAESQLAAAKTAVLATQAPAPAPARAAPAMAKSAADPFLPNVVAYRPWPARVGPAEPAASGRLLREVRAGQVVVDCTLAALVTHPVCTLAAARGQDAFSAAALAWLRQMRVQYAPAPDSTSPALPDHRWRVVFEDFSGQEKRTLP